MDDEQAAALLQAIAQLQQQLQEVEDREAIRDCLYRYSRGLDRHDSEMLRSVYHADAIDHHAEFYGPPEEFVPWAHAGHERKRVAHTHFITNPRVEIDGDVAHSESYVLFVLRNKDGGGVDLGGGRYIDRFERRGGAWRIAAREHLVEWQTHGEDTLVEGLATSYPSGTWDKSDPSYRRPFEL